MKKTNEIAKQQGSLNVVDRVCPWWRLHPAFAAAAFLQGLHTPCTLHAVAWADSIRRCYALHVQKTCFSGIE